MTTTYFMQLKNEIDQAMRKGATALDTMHGKLVKAARERDQWKRRAEAAENDARFAARGVFVDQMRETIKRQQEFMRLKDRAKMKLEAKIRELQSEVAYLRNRLSESDVAKLKRERTGLQRTNDSLVSEVGRLKKYAGGLVKEIERLQSLVGPELFMSDDDRSRYEIWRSEQSAVREATKIATELMNLRSRMIQVREAVFDSDERENDCF